MYQFAGAGKENMLFGDVTLLGKSVNENHRRFTDAASIVIAAAYVQLARNSVLEITVSADTIVYLTQKMPVYGRRLKIRQDGNVMSKFLLQYQRRKDISRILLV